MFKPIAAEKKEAILKKIKEEGATANSVAIEFGVSPKTVYHWLSKEGEKSGVSWPLYNRLKAENEQLKRIIGELTLDVKRRSKKN